MDSSGNLVAIVTGGSNGIGAATAQLLHTNDVEVVVLDYEKSSDFDSIQLDLRDLNSVDIAIDETVNRYGTIDYLVNSAGISVPSPLAGLSMETLRKTMEINLEAPIFLMKKVGELMCNQGFGRIVNVSSIHSKLSEVTSIAYDSSKAGLEAATRTAALEFAEFGVLVNAVSPGFVNTRMSMVDGQPESESDWFRNFYIENERLPLRRSAQPLEIAELIYWLCSPLNTYVTGQAIAIDGGLSIRF